MSIGLEGGFCYPDATIADLISEFRVSGCWVVVACGYVTTVALLLQHWCDSDVCPTVYAFLGLRVRNEKSWCIADCNDAGVVDR